MAGPRPLFSEVFILKGFKSVLFICLRGVFILNDLNMAVCTKIVQGTEVLQIADLRGKGLPKSKNASKEAGATEGGHIITQ